MFSETTFLCSTQPDGRLGLAELSLVMGRCRCAFASHQLGEHFLECLNVQEAVQLRPFDELAAGVLYGSADSLMMFESESAIRAFANEMRVGPAGTSGLEAASAQARSEPDDLLSSGSHGAQQMARHSSNAEFGP